jgi:hypothetical protein
MAPVMAFFTIMMVRGLRLRGYPTQGSTTIGTSPAAQPSSQRVSPTGGRTAVAVAVQTVSTTVSHQASPLSRLGHLRAFGGTDDRLAPNLVAAIVASHIIFFLPMIPALAIRFAGWCSQIGSATPFGFPAYPF